MVSQQDSFSFSRFLWFTVFFLAIVVLVGAGIFMGSITGQVVRGEEVSLSFVELSILVIAFFALLEVAILVFTHVRKKETPISELIEEARNAS